MLLIYTKLCPSHVVTLFGSIIELITSLRYDEKEKLILTVQNINEQFN